MNIFTLNPNFKYKTKKKWGGGYCVRGGGAGVSDLFTMNANLNKKNKKKCFG